MKPVVSESFGFSRRIKSPGKYSLMESIINVLPSFLLPNKYVLSVYPEPGTMLVSRYPRVAKTLKGIALVEIQSHGRQAPSKSSSK